MEKELKKVGKGVEVSEERCEEIASTATNKMKLLQKQKLLFHANERQYILSLLKKYFGRCR